MLLIVFAVLAAIELISVVLIFTSRNALHSIIMLALAFLASSLLFAAMQEPLLALLQLFVIIGGVLTYLFIGVASVSYSRFKHTSYLYIAALSLVLFIVIAYSVRSIDYINSINANVLTRAMIAGSLSSNIGVLYIIAIALFGIGLGAIILLKRLDAE